MADGLLSLSHPREEFRKILSQVHTLQESTQAYLAVAARYSPEIGDVDALSPSEAVSRVKGVLKDYQEMQSALQERAKLQERIEQTRVAKKTAEEKIDNLRNLITACISGQTETMNRWRTWLIQRSLDSSLSTKQTTDLLRRLTEVNSRVLKVEELEEQLNKLRGELSRFEQSASSELAMLNISPNGLPALFQQVTDLHEKLIEQQMVEASKAQSQKALDSARQDVESEKLAEETAQHKMQALLALACVESEEAFEKKWRQSKKIHELTKDVETARLQLTRFLQKDEFAETESGYETFDDVATRRRIKDLEAKVKDLTDELERVGDEEGGGPVGLRHQLANLIGERDRLANSEKLLECQQKEETLRAELQVLANEWTKYAIARELLARAKKRFETEGLPQVIELATEMFGHMTAGAYSQLIPGDEAAIEVVNRAGARIAAEFLSTGTQEQLYLALRFAFIRYRNALAEPLPIVMDDILVNFDDQRASNAAEVMNELSLSNQILYFTCHPATVALLRRACPNAITIDLSTSATLEAAMRRLLAKPVVF